MIGGLRAALAGLIVLLAWTGTATAAPTWSPAVSVMPGDTLAIEGPAAAYDGSGELRIVWASDDGVSATLPAARRPLGGPFAVGPALAVDDSPSEPALTRGPSGELFAAWVVAIPAGSPVVAARLAPDGTPIAPRAFSGAAEDAIQPAIAVAADGTIAVAWTSIDDVGDSEVRVVHGTLDGSPRPPAVVASAGEAVAVDPELAFDAGGVLHVAWTSVNAEDEGAIKDAVELPGGGFSRPRSISPADADADEPALVALAGAGVALAWTEITDTAQTVRVRVEVPGQPVTTASLPDGGDSFGPRLATDPDGTLHVAWISAEDERTEVMVAARGDAGTFAGAQSLSPGETADSVALAFSPQGDAVVAWLRFFGDEEEPSGEIRASVFDAPRAPSPPPPPQPPPPPVAQPPDPPPPAAQPPAPPPPAELAQPAPALSLRSFAVTPTCIRYGNPPRGPRGRLAFTFELSEPATVILTIERRLNSRPLAGCPAGRVRGAPGKLGPPFVLELPAAAGAGTIPTGGEGQVLAARVRPRSQARVRVRLRRGFAAGRRSVIVRNAETALAPGTYVARLTARSADGRTADAGKQKFWVLASSG